MPQIQSAKLTDCVNVINFAGLFSGTAVGPPRRVSGRLTLVSRSSFFDESMVAIDSGQLVAKACGFIAIFRSLSLVLRGAGVSHDLENLADAIALALAHALELAREIILV